MSGLDITKELSIDYVHLLKQSKLPLWLLDIDGVLRAFDADPDWPESPVTRTSGHLSVKFAPSLIDWIRDVIREGSVDVVWSTTWCGRIEQMLALFDLPGWSTHEDAPGTTEAWDFYINGPEAVMIKLASVQAAIDSGRPVIHTDDHVAVSFDSPNYLAIRPDTERGLSQDHMLRIAAFIKNHQ
jgi:hypothetical protein